MTGLPLLDYAAGELAKHEGIARVEASNERFVAVMRVEARRIAAERGEVHIDDLRRRACELEISPKSSGAWGSLFAERKVWRKIGYRPSRWPGNNSHSSPVWELIEKREVSATA